MIAFSLAVLILGSNLMVVFADNLYPITPTSTPTPTPTLPTPTAPSKLPGNVNIKHNRDIKGYREETSVKASSNNYESHVEVNIELNQKLKNIANTVVLDLSKFDLMGHPYEIALMRDYLRNMPEYKFGDIIDFKEEPINLEGREFYQYEHSLVRDGIVRQLSDITYKLDESKGMFTWNKDNKFTFKDTDEIKKTYFLASLGRVAGLNDNVYISARSSATWIPNNELSETRVKGRQMLEESPYKKDVTSQVDIGMNIVLVDYDDREYLIIKLDNIYRPYINYLANIGVIDKEEEKDVISCSTGITNERDTTGYIRDMIRVNYDKIPVSGVPIINDDSSKDFEEWKSQVDVRRFIENEEDKYAYPPYKIEEECGIQAHQEYVAQGELLTNYFKLKAQVPQIMKEEDISNLEALSYIYKYLWYNEKEITLNKMEVDTVVSLYGLQLAGYTYEEVEQLKYLIAKGIINPQEDDLSRLNESLKYKDLLKYLYRLKYKDKRFDFKTLMLTTEDIKMMEKGYMQDNIRVSKDDNSYIKEIRKETLKQVEDIEDKAGYDKILIQLPTQDFLDDNYILSDSKKYNVVFETVPVKIENKVYAYASIPKSFGGELVLRSTKVDNGFSIPLKEWADESTYKLNPDMTEFIEVAKLNSEITAYGLEIDMNKYFNKSENIKIQVDPNKPIEYKHIRMFKEGKFNKEEIDTELFDYDGTYLIIKGIQTVGEAMSVISDIEAPPNLSSNDITFMGYSQLSANGRKLSLIRDLDMNKLGITVLEDNVLYNEDLDTYAYLDPRTSTLYYGNTVVRYKPDTMMVEGVPGQESTFYNLDVVKTILSRVESNNSISNEVLNLLPRDHKFTVLDKAGDIQDKVYMHQGTVSSDKDWWLNTATLSGRNSNFIYFRDDSNGGFSIYINYRSRGQGNQNKGGKVTNNNNLHLLLEDIKNVTPKPHPSTNVIMQSILAYNGIFTDENYNYGIKLLYPQQQGGTPYTKDKKMEQVKTSFYKFLNLFPDEDSKNKFFKTVNNADFLYGIKMPSTGENSVDFKTYFENLSSKSDMTKSVYFNAEEYVTGDLATDSRDLAVKILNNNMYIRFNNFNSFDEIKYGTKYHLTGTLTYLYNMNEDKKNLKIVGEKINYENTDVGFIPLEDWAENTPIGNQWKVQDKIAIRWDLGAGNQAYLFDRLKARTKGNGHSRVYMQVEKDVDHKKTLDIIYQELKDKSISFKNSMDGSILNTELTRDIDKLEKFVAKSISGSTNLLDDSVGSSDKLAITVWTENRIKDIKKGTRKVVNWLADQLGGTHVVTEGDIENKNFYFKKNVTYKFEPLFLFPCGTQLVEVGVKDYTTGEYLKGKENNYKLVTSINKRPRTIKGELYDIVNQTIAVLFEDTTLGKIPKGSLLILPSGLKMVAMGNGEFLTLRGEELGSTIKSEEVLLWRYLAHFNIRVGLQANTINGLEGIRLPTYEEFTDVKADNIKNLAKEYWTDIDSKKVVYIKDGEIHTGKLKKDLKDDGDNLDKNAKMYPVAKFNNDISVVKLFERKEDKKQVYIMRDLSMSVDQGFVDYLRAGIINVNSPKLGDVSLDDYLMENNQVKMFQMRNISLLFGRLVSIIRYVLPWLLIIYGVISGAFIILLSMPLIRDTMEYFLPYWLYRKMFRIFTVFTANADEEIPLLQGTVRASAVMAIGIFWLSAVTRNLQ